VEPKLILKCLTIYVQQIVEKKALFGVTKSVACHHRDNSSQAKFTFHLFLKACSKIFNLLMRELVAICHKFSVNITERLNLFTCTRCTKMAHVFVKAGSYK
jgi:hypothetical protein